MTPPLLILAQRGNGKGLESLFENLQSAMYPSQVGPPWVLIFLGVVAGLVSLLLILALIKSRRQGQEGSSRACRPKRLFNKALKALGVGLLDRVMMRMIARKTRIPQPTVMLFSPAILQRYATAWIDSITIPMLRRRARARVKVVAARAFG
jgi:hypothetical protein